MFIVDFPNKTRYVWIQHSFPRAGRTDLFRASTCIRSRLSRSSYSLEVKCKVLKDVRLTSPTFSQKVGRYVYIGCTQFVDSRCLKMLFLLDVLERILNVLDVFSQHYDLRSNET